MTEDYEIVKDPVHCRNCDKKLKLGEKVYGGVNYPGTKYKPFAKQFCKACYDKYLDLNKK